MNPDFLPAIGASLRALCAFEARHQIDDQTLTDLAAEIERARTAVANARAASRVNRCTVHPGSPIDPAAENGCLFCGPSQRRPARPIPEGVVPANVLTHIDEHGEDAAIRTFGPLAVARALHQRGRTPNTQSRPGRPAGQTTEGEH